MSKQGKRVVTLEISLDSKGNLRIDIPHDRNQARNANAAADFTDKLARAIGDIDERHIGDHTHHVDGSITYHDHNHQSH